MSSRFSLSYFHSVVSAVTSLYVNLPRNELSPSLRKGKNRLLWIFELILQVFNVSQVQGLRNRACHPRWKLRLLQELAKNWGTHAYRVCVCVYCVCECKYLCVCVICLLSWAVCSRKWVWLSSWSCFSRKLQHSWSDQAAFLHPSHFWNFSQHWSYDSLNLGRLLNMNSISHKPPYLMSPWPENEC